MQILGVELPRKHRLFYAGDIHEGTIQQHKDGLSQLIDAVGSSKDNYLVLMGDLAECIEVNDKRYCRATEDPATPTPIKQYNSLVDKFYPIRKQILVTLAGNHDLKIASRFGNGVSDIFCRGLGIPYGTYTCKLAINGPKKKLQYKNFLSHGFGSISPKHADPARREAAKQAALRDKLYLLAGDCAIQAMGHTHQLIIRKPYSELYLTDDTVKLKHKYTSSQQTDEYILPDLRWYLNTGGFHKLYSIGASGYAEMKGYVPNELGYIVSEVEGGIIQDMKRVILH